MKREDQNAEIRKLQQEYEDSLKEGRYPVFDSDDYADLAQYYYEQGLNKKAREVVDTALTVYPDADMPLLFLARYTMLEENDMEKSKEILDRVSDKFSADYAFGKAEWLLYSGRSEEAVILLDERFDDVCGERETADYAEDACRFFLNFRQVNNARLWLDRMPDKTSRRYQLLAAEVERVDDNWEACAKMLSDLVDKDPFCCTAWVELAKVQFDLDQIQEAGESCDYALAIEPDNLDAVLIKGDIMNRLGNLEEAEKCYRSYLAEYPSSPGVINQLALTMISRDEHNLDKALPMIQKAKGYVNHNFEVSQYADILQTEAYIYCCMGNMDKALDDIETIRKLKCRDDDELDFLRANVYLQNGKQLEACLVYDRILRQKNWPLDMVVRVGVCLFDNRFFEIGNYEMDQALKMHSEEEYTAELLAIKAIFAFACRNMEEYEHFRKKALEKDEARALAILQILDGKE